MSERAGAPAHEGAGERSVDLLAVNTILPPACVCSSDEPRLLAGFLFNCEPSAWFNKPILTVNQPRGQPWRRGCPKALVLLPCRPEVPPTTR